MFRIHLILIFFYSLIASAQETRTDLQNWYFIDASKSMNIDGMFPATVPGVVHTDLMDLYEGAFDFYKNNNENSEKAKWFESQNWIYSTSFEMKESEIVNKNIELVFEGLDTYADVYLNDSLILRADNMFRTWIIPVQNSLQIGTNILEVHFTSPLNYHKEKIKNAPYKLPSGNETGKIQVSAYTRKAAYQFGWDFGPRFVTCGIWRPCYLRTWNNARLKSFVAVTKSINTTDKTAEMEFCFTLEDDDSIYGNHDFLFLGERLAIDFASWPYTELRFKINLENVKFWNPNGNGAQNLYKENFVVKNAQGDIVLEDTVTFGVRTIELINEPDEIGTSFYFNVNGKPVFIKGANYIPQDLFLPRVTNEQTLRLLTQVKDANMNMIRVWGGGIYESDYFYSVCDSLGIMVWQDFMFANSMYPNDAAFHESVAHEVEDNVIRLRNHPCIALWCGNNEIEVAWNNWGWQKQFGYSKKDSTEIWENYKHIFEEIIPEKLFWHDPDRPYIPSSPQSNWGTKENFNHGAMHYWGVWHGKEDLDSFKTNVGRFMVEYGIQSYPLEEWLKPTIANHIDPNDPVFKNLQKSYIGDVLIKKEIQNYFGDLENFSDWLFASQYIQSHRLAAPHCMGTMFWQLNDCWPGASWSVIDYYGNEKIAYTEIKNQFSPIIAIIDTTNNEFSVIVQSEIPFEGKMMLYFYDALDNMSKPIKIIDTKFSTNTLVSIKVISLKLKKYLSKLSASPRFINIRITNKEDELYFEDNFYYSKLRIDEVY